VKRNKKSIFSLEKIPEFPTSGELKVLGKHKTFIIDSKFLLSHSPRTRGILGTNLFGSASLPAFRNPKGGFSRHPSLDRSFCWPAWSLSVGSVLFALGAFLTMEIVGLQGMRDSNGVVWNLWRKQRESLVSSKGFFYMLQHEREQTINFSQAF